MPPVPEKMRNDPLPLVTYHSSLLTTRADTEEFGHLVVQEALAWFVRLDPFAVEDELWDAAFAGLGDDLVGGAGGRFDIDLGVGNRVRGEKAFGLATVAAPIGRINKKIHRDIVADMAR
jgi:hypothetical protein